MNCTFEIKQMPERAIIYCRHQGALDQMQEAFANLMKWALPRGFVSQPDMRLLSVYHDDPRVTPVDKLTADAAMFVPEEMKPEGIIGSYKLSSGLYAVGRFELSMSEFPAAWMAMFDLLEENDIIMRFIRITMTNIRKKSLLWIFVYLLNRYNREGGCIICLWHMNNTDQADLHGKESM